MSEQYAEAFIELVNAGVRMGVENIKDMPGCWENGDPNDGWFVALNGHKEKVKCSAGVEVEPYTAYVSWNGWPAGILGPNGGVVAAGEVANEDAFIEWVKGLGK